MIPLNRSALSLLEQQLFYRMTFLKGLDGNLFISRYLTFCGFSPGQLVISL